MMGAPRILVANRGEIAVRVLSSARELGLYTITLSTADDDAHASYAHETIQLPSASSYRDVDTLVSLCKANHISLVHPGYGFLSESPEFCEKLEAAGITFVGPSPAILRRTGDKLSARRLAQDCGVPILPALTAPVKKVDDLRAFAQDAGFPIMIKAVDGGGGRGIRLVKNATAMESSFERAVNESPSKQVFAEKAAVGGFRHVEVQVLGDGRGNVCHFWERECSIQRRFQKIVEVAPAPCFSGSSKSQNLRACVIDAALHMAKQINYSSLGTWEFLVSSDDSKFYFMEVNPRLQVEHTITETICGVDLVRLQLLQALSRMDQAQARSFKLPGATAANHSPPSSFAVQLRITAENPQQNFSPSIGRIRHVVWPGGNGVRVDTHLRTGTIITPDFDSLLAKVIITGPDWNAVVEKAARALQDTVVEGVATNLMLLQTIVRAKDFQKGDFDTQWLENNLQHILEMDQNLSRHANIAAFRSNSQMQDFSPRSKPTDDLIRKGDIFNIRLEGGNVPANLGGMTMSVTSVIRNDFPHTLALKLSPHDKKHDPSSKSARAEDGDYVLRVSKQTEAQQNSRLGTNKSKDGRTSSSIQLVCPIAGQLVEVLVDEGDRVKEGDAVVIVRQMKMELEVRAHQSGVVRELFTLEEGESISVGTDICSIVPKDGREKL